jgi:diguanylate cyclase (GGDEF)-like protein/PAS domain S-box-containing protein
LEAPAQSTGGLRKLVGQGYRHESRHCGETLDEETDNVDPGQRKENYFLNTELDELVLSLGQGEMTDGSRVISAQFEKILDALPFYVLLIDTNHTIQFANNAFRKTYDVTLAELQGKYCPKFVHGLDHAYAGCPVEAAIKGGATEREFFAKEHNRWLLTTAYPTGAKTKDGLDLYYHTTRDITEHKEAEAAVRASEQKYRRLFEDMEDAIFVMSPDGLLQDMNRAGLELLQIRAGEKLSAINLFNDLSLVDSEWDPFIDALKTRGHVIDYEVSFKRPDGKIVITSINASLEHDESDTDGVIRGIMRDLTRNRELEQRSTIDEMTTLYNHGFFQSYLVNQVRHIRAGRGSDLSLLFLDIDDFKAYNDAYGHQEGDYVLRQVGEAIKTALRGEDVAARYGGEEFTIILGCDYAAAAVIAERVRSTVEDFCSSFADGRIRRSVTASVGISTFGRDADVAERLVNIADARMYEAKKLGKNQVFAGEPQVSGQEGPGA